ncbi:MAG: hypothetical protein N3B18_09900 [Desulfobacterota bacterium]|nr:hypothetical protein [Thermodesulfobacteriota bacterium]
MKNPFTLVLFMSLMVGTLTIPDQCAGQRAKNEYNDTAVSESFGARLGRYTLIEDELDDIPRRITRYDYLKEAAEPLRLFSRHPGPECAILNLQWHRGSIFINDFTIVPGEIRKRKWLEHDGSGDTILYRLFSRDNRLLQHAHLELKPTLYFDSLDETDGTLSGGAYRRDKYDFILKIPLLDKAACKIFFYRQTAPLKQRIPSGVGTGQEREEIVIGGAEF